MSSVYYKYIYFTKIKNSTSPTSSQLIGEVVS